MGRDSTNRCCGGVSALAEDLINGFQMAGKVVAPIPLTTSLQTSEPFDFDKQQAKRLKERQAEGVIKK